MDKNLYSIMKPTNHGGYKKTFFFGMLMFVVMDTWAAFEEYKLQREYEATGDKPQITKVPRRSLYTFMANTVNQIGEFYL